MANICENKLTVISKDDDEHARFWSDAKGATSELSFSSLLPRPDDTAASDWIGSNWGAVMYEDVGVTFTKLNLYISKCQFDTKWGAPAKLFFNIRDRYPNTTFVLEAISEFDDIPEIYLVDINTAEFARKEGDELKYNSIRKKFEGLMVDLYETIDD